MRTFSTLVLISEPGAEKGHPPLAWRMWSLHFQMIRLALETSSKTAKTSRNSRAIVIPEKFRDTHARTFFHRIHRVLGHSSQMGDEPGRKGGESRVSTVRATTLCGSAIGFSIGQLRRDSGLSRARIAAKSVLVTRIMGTTAPSALEDFVV